MLRTNLKQQHYEKKFSVGKEFNMAIEYIAEADKSSWNDMKPFFNSLFTKEQEPKKLIFLNKC